LVQIFAGGFVTFPTTACDVTVLFVTELIDEELEVVAADVTPSDKHIINIATAIAGNIFRVFI
jgi:hypothetical protein